MLTYEEAIAHILDQAASLPAETAAIADSLDCVLAEDIRAPFPIPRFDNSAMDGYAVRYADVQKAVPERPVLLPVTAQIAAGAGAPDELASGTAARIMTGAPLPNGADTVVPFEDTEPLEHTDRQDAHVLIREIEGLGQHVRYAGEGVAAGTAVVTAGSRIRPAEIGMFAMTGYKSVPVYPRPKVAVISTGDELIEIGEPLKSGQIYNSNLYTLAAQVEEAGGRVIRRLHAADTADSLRAAFDDCAGADMIITSGGVSVGDHDYVKAVFAERGAVDFWRVAIRPGKPFAMGRRDSSLFFGLPGNPVSSMVTFELFVRPAIRKMRGLTDIFRPQVQAVVTEEFSHTPGRRDYQRAVTTLENDLYTTIPAGGQGSGMLHAMVQCNSLLVIPSEIASIAPGESTTVILLS